MNLRKKLIKFIAPTILFTSLATAQDMLPRDNGFVDYHRQPRWRESESHPLRIFAYILHPIGWTMRELMFRPFSYFAGSSTATKSVFGFREPFDFREPLCFDDTTIPDCKTVAPFTQIGRDFKRKKSCENCEKQIFIPDVAFEFDKSNLNKLGQGRVRQIAQILSNAPSVKVIVEGHADYYGTDEYNMRLGARRAMSVIKGLTELGIEPTRLSPISYGESRPVYTEQEDWARAVNRRVQFTVLGEGQVPPTMPQELLEPKKNTSASGLPKAKTSKKAPKKAKAAPKKELKQTKEKKEKISDIEAQLTGEAPINSAEKVAPKESPTINKTSAAPKSEEVKAVEKREISNDLPQPEDTSKGVEEIKM